MLRITNIISHFAGLAAYCKLPTPLATLSVKAFAKLYNINIEEAAKPLSAYKTVGEFFTRNLKDGSRPIGDGIVSPVDGRLRNFGTINGDLIEQIKGRTYSIREFLIKPEYAQMFSNGYFYNFYLSPQNYHHIHAPFSGNIVDKIHVAGSLLPVNDWSLNHCKEVFTRNERTILILDTSIGKMAIVMVAALNVGGIELTKDLSTPDIQKGERVGTFKLGSTVVLLFERKEFTPVSLTPDQSIKYGESIALF